MLYTKAPCGKVDVNKKCYKADIYMKYMKSFKYQTISSNKVTLCYLNDHENDK